MARPRDCIYCGNNVGSREHTLPAALGGRRENKGICCGTCNSGFSPLDAALALQLSGINGLIGVRPDHEDAPRRARVNYNERLVEIDASGTPSFVTPIQLSARPDPDGSEVISIEFADQAQADRWIAEQRRSGRKIVQTSFARHRRFLTESPQLPWSFGGFDAFREIGRIAINFIASEWPLVARLDGLRGLKEFVTGKDDARAKPWPVWYTPRRAPPLPQPSNQFAHQILLKLGTANEESFARIRFFSSIDFIVRLGRLDCSGPRVRLVEINPLVESPPDDRVHEDFDPSIFQVWQFPETAIVEVGAMQEQVAELASKIRDYWWDRNSEMLRKTIGSLRQVEHEKRVDRIVDALHVHDGHVFALMRFVITELKPQLSEFGAVATNSLDKMIALDEGRSDGLDAEAALALQQCRLRIAMKIAKDLEAGPISDERIRMILCGGPGASIVGEVVAAMCFQRLNNRNKEH